MSRVGANIVLMVWLGFCRRCVASQLWLTTVYRERQLVRTLDVYIYLYLCRGRLRPWQDEEDRFEVKCVVLCGPRIMFIVGDRDLGFM